MMHFQLEQFDNSGQDWPVLRFNSCQSAIDKAHEIVNEMDADGVQGYASVNQYNGDKFVTQVFWRYSKAVDEMVDG